MRRRPRPSNALLVAVTLALTACEPSSPHVELNAPVTVPATTEPTPSTAPATEPSVAMFEPILDVRLHNAHRVTDQVISGAQPDDDAAFQALRKLGVKTIISVDGVKPDLLLAKKYGMTYVHRPTKYDGVERDDAIAVAKAIATYPGPIYLHCHHGKHRSAATLAVACVYAGTIKPEDAEKVLETFGTGKNYTGLWKAAREARPLEQGVIENAKVDFVESVQIGPLADAMVGIDLHHDHLKQAQKAGWKRPPDHLDLDPAHEALQLTEQFHEIARSEAVSDFPPDFHAMLAKSEADAKRLEALLRAKPIDTPAADGLAREIATDCTKCHKVYRDE